jgi:hypothetical protein
MSQNILRLNYLLKSQMHIHLIEAARHTPYFTLDELNKIGTECIYTTIIHQLIGVLQTEEEIEEIENLTRIFLNQHHQLQERFGLAFLKREVENEEISD